MEEPLSRRCLKKCGVGTCRFAIDLSAVARFEVLPNFFIQRGAQIAKKGRGNIADQEGVTVPNAFFDCFGKRQILDQVATFIRAFDLLHASPILHEKM